MEMHAPLSLSSLVADAPGVVGASIGPIAGLALISFGLLLPGLLTALGGRHGDPRGGCASLGPSVTPLISDPAPRRVHSLEPSPDPRAGVRLHRWPDVSESAVSHPAPGRTGPAAVRTVVVWTAAR